MAKVTIGKIEESLIDKSKQYKELTGTSTVELVEGLLAKFFEGKILTNNVIELPKPYYFNMKELQEEGIVKASTVKPIKELEEAYILLNVPNNLDLWSNKFNSYCYEDNFNLHEGYYVSDEIEKDLVFRYDSNTEEIEIAISTDRNIYFTSEQKDKKANLNKKVVIPEFEIVASYDKVKLFKYSDYKYYVLEIADRIEEDNFL